MRQNSKSPHERIGMCANEFRMFNVRNVQNEKNGYRKCLHQRVWERKFAVPAYNFRPVSSVGRAFVS